MILKLVLHLLVFLFGEVFAFFSAHHLGGTGLASNLELNVFGLKQEEKYEADKLAKELHDHSLFIAFAPIDKPRIAVAVIVEHGGSGSAVAAPIARKILDQYLTEKPS